MRSYAKKFFAVIFPLVALMLGSCSSVALYARQAETHSLFARVWVEDDPLVPKQAVLKGCRFWEAKGLLCGLVSKPEHANIRVYSDAVKCGEGESRIEPEQHKLKMRCAHASSAMGKSGRALAEAHHDGKIVVFTDCTAPGGKLDADELAITIAHEFGHQLGIWDHIPVDCADKSAVIKTHPTGRAVCGPNAVMNPSHPKGIEGITDLDALAFDLRDHRDSKIGPLMPYRPRKNAVEQEYAAAHDLP
jgi:hypothetical protein